MDRHLGGSAQRVASWGPRTARRALRMTRSRSWTRPVSSRARGRDGYPWRGGGPGSWSRNRWPVCRAPGEAWSTSLPPAPCTIEGASPAGNRRSVSGRTMRECHVRLGRSLLAAVRNAPVRPPVHRSLHSSAQDGQFVPKDDYLRIRLRHRSLVRSERGRGDGAAEGRGVTSCDLTELLDTPRRGVSARVAAS